MKLVNLHGLHQRVLLVTLHGSPQRVRARLPARHPLLASSATYTALAPLLRHYLPILSPSAYAALAPLLPSNSLYAPGGAMFEMLGRSSNQFSARHTGSRCLRGPLLILSPSACATVTHLFPSSSLPRTRKDGARDAGFPSSSLPRTRKDGVRDALFLFSLSLSYTHTHTHIRTHTHTHEHTLSLVVSVSVLSPRFEDLSSHLILSQKKAA